MSACPIHPHNINRNRLKFLIWQDLYNALDYSYLAQITNQNSQIIIDSEVLALSQVRSYLIYKYDMDHELRPILPFELSTEYPDLSRVLIQNNTEQKDFGITFSIDVLNSGLTASEYYIAVKSVNTVPPQKIEVFTDNSRYPYSSRTGDKSYRLRNTVNSSITSPEFNNSLGFFGNDVHTYVTNPDYDPNLGYFTYGTGSNKYFAGKYINYYNTIYGTNSTTTVDYVNDVQTESEFLDIYGNPDYFDQYRLSNIGTEWLNDDRNAELIQTVVQLTIYNILQRCAAHDISTHRKDLYEMTMKNLQAWSKGQKPINLKLKDDAIAKNKTGFIWSNAYGAYRYDY